MSGGNFGHARGGRVLRSMRFAGRRLCGEREREREERERPDFDSQQLFSFSLFMGSHVSQLFEIRFVLLFLFIPVRRETLKLVCRVHQAIPIAAHDLNGHLQ